MVMIALPILVLAAIVGVVLAAVDGPYPHDKKLIDRISVVVLAAGAAVVVMAGAVMVRGLLLD
jgi:hypothetical protein